MIPAQSSEGQIREVVEALRMTSRTNVERIPMTREEYFRLAEDLESGLVDWEDGFATRMNAAAHGRHGYFISFLHVRVESFLKQHRLGRAWPEIFVDFPDKPYGPDVAVLLNERLHLYRDGRINGAPDIVVEVISPDSESRDRTTKFDAYARREIKWYWIGDPEAGTLEEYRLTTEGYLRTASGSLEHPFEPRALPGLSIDINELMDVV